MVVTNNAKFHEKSVYFRNMCFPLKGPRRYIHDDIGFNYRMTNLTAALGLAQTEKADFYVRRRSQNAALYRRYLSGIPGVILQKKREEVFQPTWMNGVTVDKEHFGRSRDELAAHLEKKGIETRVFFAGMHRQPSLKKYGCDVGGNYPVSDFLWQNGLYLPSSSRLQEKEIRFICRTIARF